MLITLFEPGFRQYSCHITIYWAKLQCHYILPAILRFHGLRNAVGWPQFFSQQWLLIRMPRRHTNAMIRYDNSRCHTFLPFRPTTRLQPLSHAFHFYSHSDAFLCNTAHGVKLVWWIDFILLRYYMDILLMLSILFLITIIFSHMHDYMFSR